jgi:hypothetical protein
MHTAHGRRLAVAAATGTIVALLAAGAARAQVSPRYRCTDTGTGVVSFTGGNVFSTRPASYTFTSLDTLCNLPDPTIHSGAEVGSGTGSFNCSHAGGAFTGSFTEYWDNGRTSVGTYTERVAGGVDHTVGVFTSGEFAGMPSLYVGLDVPTTPQTCFASSGPIFGSFAGQFLFGDAASNAAARNVARRSGRPHRTRRR